METAATNIPKLAVYNPHLKQVHIGCNLVPSLHEPFRIELEQPRKDAPLILIDLEQLPRDSPLMRIDLEQPN